MAETSSVYNINDIPEELKGYRKLLLNAAFGKVFSPEYLQSLPDAGLWSPAPTSTAANTSAQNSSTPSISDILPQYQSAATVMPYQADPSFSGGNAANAMYNPPTANAAMPSSVASYFNSDADVVPQYRHLASSASDIERELGFASGGLAKIAEEIENSLGDVNLGAYGSPIGGYIPPMVVSPPALLPQNPIGTGTKTPPAPTPPSVTPPPYANNGVINTPPSGTLPVGNPNPNPPSTGTMPPHVGGPSTNIPGGGGGSPTAGVMPQFTNQRPPSFMGSQQAAQSGYNPAQFADESVAAALAKQMGGNVTYTNPQGFAPSQAMVDAGGSNMFNAGLIADIDRRFADDPGMREFALANLRKEIQGYGGSTGGFKHGGIVKLATGGFPDGAAPADVTYSPPSVLGTGTTAQTTQNAFPALNPWQPYGQQRVLGFDSGFGQQGANGTLQASNLTQNALSAYGNLPSYFQNGEINADRDVNGNATTPLGIANDMFDASGNLALNASQLAQDMTWRTPLTSTFANTMQYLQQNPSQFQAGDITLGQLSAPQIDQPLGVGTSQLTSYQMAGPQMVDTSGSNINPLYVNGPNLSNIQTDVYDPRGYVGNSVTSNRNFVDPGVAQQYISPYMQNVVDIQTARAKQNYDEQNAARSAAAIRAGAFGGNREAVADSLAARDQQELLNTIQATGSQAAYENAQQQFERDRAAGMGTQQFNAQNKLQADLANQGANQALRLANLQSLLTTQGLGANLGQQAQLANQSAYGSAAAQNQQASLQAQLANQNALQQANQFNTQAALGVQELGANQALQAALANQGAGLTAAQANLNAALNTQQLARNSGLTAAQANQQTRLTQNQALLDAQARADQLQQQAAQGNVSNQLQALGQQTNSALAANQIGQSRADLSRLAQAMELQRLQQMQQAGQQVDARTQSALDLGYQDWINAQNYPYQQMGWLQSMLAGVPIGYNQESVQFQKTNPLSQLAGLGTAALGAYTQSKAG